MPPQRPSKKPRSSPRARRALPPRRGRVHPFLFFGTAHRSRDHEPYQARDMVCLPHLLAALHDQGYRLGEMIFNTPVQRDQPARSIAPVGLRLAADDALLVVTRLPLNDAESDKKRVLRGYTDFEPLVLDASRRVFSYLSRAKMIQQPELWRHARDGFENRVNIRYYLQNGANFDKLRRAEKGAAEKLSGPARTSAFLLNLELRPGGPRLICAFGMDSHATMVWSQILARQHPQWLAQPGFTMVDLIRQKVPKRPVLLTFAQEWRYEIVMRVRL